MNVHYKLISDVMAYSGSVFGEGSGPIRIGGFQCNATNTQILDCVHTEYPDCSHKHDAGVSCRANNCTENGVVQLARGNSQFEGTVNVCVNGSWNTICDSMWGNSDAVVVCRQLQYSTVGESYILVHTIHTQTCINACTWAMVHITVVIIHGV